jgi:hypothetical protein
MNITLHWWIIPILISIGGYAYAWYDNRLSGYYSGMVGAIVFVACIGISIGIVIGHFL